MCKGHVPPDLALGSPAPVACCKLYVVSALRDEASKKRLRFHQKHSGPLMKTCMTG